MNNYFVMLLAFIIGQALYTAITVNNLQKGKKIGYWPALRAYTEAEVGQYIVVLCGLAALMFVITDFVDPSFRKEDADLTTWKGRLVAYFRSIMLVVGVFAQHIIFLAFKKGKKKLEEADQQL